MTQRRKVGEFAQPDPYGREEYEQKGVHFRATGVLNVFNMDGSAQLAIVDTEDATQGVTVVLPALSEANLGCRFKIQLLSKTGSAPQWGVTIQAHGTDPVNENDEPIPMVLRGANACMEFVHLRFGFVPFPVPGHPAIDSWYCCGLALD